MSDPTRPTLAELQADGLTPEIMLDMIGAELAMHGEYACSCGVAGDDQSAVEACRKERCYFRDEDGKINAPYLDRAELLKTRKHYEKLANEAQP